MDSIEQWQFWDWNFKDKDLIKCQLFIILSIVLESIGKFLFYISLVAVNTECNLHYSRDEVKWFIKLHQTQTR